MKTAGVMKRIALAFMVMAMAVAMVACQGAVGKAGADGADGQTGPQGPKGDSGDDAVTPLQAYPNDKGQLDLLINDGPEVALGTPPAAFSALMYFMGGHKPVKVTSDGVPDADAAAFSVEVTDGMVTIKKKTGTPTDTAYDYAATGGDSFMVNAEDDKGFRVDPPVTVTVRRNKAPVVVTPTDPLTVTVGTQDATAVADSKKVCDNFNVDCTTDPSDGFTDDGLADSIAADYAYVKALFSYSVTEGHSAVSVETGSDGNLMVTVNRVPKDKDDAFMRVVNFKLKAVDPGSIVSEGEKTLAVTVDPAPTTVGTLNDGNVLEVKIGTSNAVALDVTSYFENYESDVGENTMLRDNLNYTVTIDGKGDNSEGPNRLDFTESSGTVTLTGVSVGTGIPVVVRATESGQGLSQWAEHKLTVNVVR